MNKRILFSAALLLGGLNASAQVLLNDFSAVEAEASFLEWTGSQGPGLYTFAGTTSDEAGVEFGGTWDLTGLTSLAFTAQSGAGNAASSFVITLFDEDGATAASTFAFSSYDGAAATTVLSAWVATATFDVSRVTGLRISGGEFLGSTALELTADQLTATASAIPEPSTYAALLGLATLGVAGWRRRQVGQK